MILNMIGGLIPSRYHGQQYHYIQEYQEDFISLVFLLVISILSEQPQPFLFYTQYRYQKNLERQPL